MTYSSMAWRAAPIETDPAITTPRTVESSTPAVSIIQHLFGHTGRFVAHRRVAALFVSCHPGPPAAAALESNSGIYKDGNFPITVKSSRSTGVEIQTLRIRWLDYIETIT
jgi:hypothetical protein